MMMMMSLISVLEIELNFCKKALCTYLTSTQVFGRTREDCARGAQEGGQKKGPLTTGYGLRNLRRWVGEGEEGGLFGGYETDNFSRARQGCKERKGNGDS